MKINELEKLELSELVFICERYNIGKISVAGVSLEFGKEKVYTDKAESTFKDDLEESKLSCGHYTWESSEGGACLHGCDLIAVKEE